MSDLTVSYAVPYVCQYASPDRVRAFVYGEQPLESDPHWAAYGAASPEEYAHWARRSCGVVCVKMAVEALSRAPSRSVMAWVQAGLAIDGYLAELRPERPDQPVEKGWKHAALARLIRDQGLEARTATDMGLDDLAAHIRADRLVIASVSSELGEVDTPITRRSGHLIVVLGVAMDRQGMISHVIAHNPSGRVHDLQAHARLPADRFMQGFSGRGIVAAHSL